MSGVKGWWAKLQLFNRATGLEGRVVYLDLDTLIVGSLDAIIDWPAPFATVPDGGSTFRPIDGRQVVKRFNSSVMVFDAGAYQDLYLDWSLGVARRLWGDQDWLAERHPDAQTMPAAWFPRLSSIGSTGEIPADARVILAKVPKNAEAADRWPWVNAIWRAA
jgi:alpha-N-acetylglucosamine transferase